MGDKYSIAGSNFGHIGPVNNFGPQRLTFNLETAAQLLESLPEKKAIDLRTVGSDSAHKVGAEYQSFLIEKGYKVQRSITGILSPPPDKKITVADVGGHYIVTIAPDA